MHQICEPAASTYPAACMCPTCCVSPDAPAVYITKPKGSIQGRGIRLTANPLKKAENDVVQQYISDPLLIDGFKFDLRIYVRCCCANCLSIRLIESAGACG